jgi:hypothetical protein
VANAQVSSFESGLNHYPAAGYHESAPEPRLPIGLAYLLAGAGSLFLWGLIGTALWQVFG